jgi:peroxiredoxin Q/BCP
MKLATVLGLLATSLLPVVGNAALKANDEAPAFSAQASLAGKAFQYSLKDALQKGTVVVYFYPSAFTSGCNIQAHTFATRIDDFKAAGASVIGVSLDSIERLNQFSADPDYCAGKLPVASDADGSIAKSYDLQVHAAMPGFKDSRGAQIDHGFAERTTFIVTPDGKVAATVGGVSPAQNVEHTLQLVQQLSNKSSVK